MDNEGEVASILVELRRLFMESTHQVQLENLRWGVRRCRTQTLYEIMSKSEQAEQPNDPTEPMSSDLQNKKGGGPTSPMKPLGLPNSSTEEQLVPPSTKQVEKKKSMKEDLTRELLELQDKPVGIRQPTNMAPLPQPSLIQPNNPTEPMSSVLPNKKEGLLISPMTPLGLPNKSSKDQLVPPPTKQVKKKKSKKEWLMEKKEEVALLSKEKEDLTRELLELQDKCWRLKAMNIYLKDKKSKLKPVGIRHPTNMSSLNFMRELAPPPQPPLIQFNLDAMVASLTCQLDRNEKAAKSALARKRRMEILQERRASSTHKRQRVQ